MNRIIKHAIDNDTLEILNKFPRVLMDDEEKKWTKYLKEYKIKYDNLPSLSNFVNQFPLFVPGAYSDPRDLLESAINKKKRDEINRVMSSIDMNDLDGSTKEIAILKEKLMVGPSSLMSMGDFNRKILYSKAIKPHFLISERITEALKGGVRDGEVVTIIGRYGSAKSIVAEYSVVKWALSGENVMVISNDMSSLATAMRLDSFLVHRDVSIMTEDELDVLDYITNLIYSNIAGKIIIPEKPVKRVEEVVALAKQESATILVVDGAYLLKGSDKGTKSWENISSVTNELTYLAHELSIPVILISQANRQGDVAFSNSFAQDADIVLKLDDELDTPSEEDVKLVFVTSLKNRRGKPVKNYITVDFKDWEVKDTKFSGGI